MSEVRDSSTESALAVLVGIRQRIQKLAQSLPEDVLFAIPPGFSNNIAWNLGHLVVTQRILCYRLSGLPLDLPDEQVQGFQKGSSPADWASRPNLSEVIDEQLVACAGMLREDYRRGRFQKFESYTTSAGITLTSIEDAIHFNNVHEGIHLGYVMALHRAVKVHRDE